MIFGIFKKVLTFFLVETKNVESLSFPGAWENFFLTWKSFVATDYKKISLKMSPGDEDARRMNGA